MMMLRMMLLLMMVKMLLMMIRWDIPFRKYHSRSSSLYSSHPYGVLPVVVVVVVVLGGMRVGSILGGAMVLIRD